ASGLPLPLAIPPCRLHLQGRGSKRTAGEAMETVDLTMDSDDDLVSEAGPREQAPVSGARVVYPGHIWRCRTREEREVELAEERREAGLADVPKEVLSDVELSDEESSSESDEETVVVRKSPVWKRPKTLAKSLARRPGTCTITGKPLHGHLGEIRKPGAMAGKRARVSLINGGELIRGRRATERSSKATEDLLALVKANDIGVGAVGSVAPGRTLI
ncbi:hypothetical protein P7C70_g6212, partial [Phenoliferia sp. Uapishka_3]